MISVPKKILHLTDSLQQVVAHPQCVGEVLVEIFRGDGVGMRGGDRRYGDPTHRRLGAEAHELDLRRVTARILAASSARSNGLTT